MTVKLGIVGTGIFATDSHLPAIKQVPGLELTGAFNRTKAKAERFAQHAGIPADRVFDSVDSLITNKDIDAIDALVPVEHNLSIVETVLKAGKPLAIEKPIAGNLDDARQIVKLTNESTTPVLILENWLYHSSTSKLKELLPKIGKVVTFVYQSTGPFAVSKYHATPWRQNPKHVGGYLSDGGVHEVALVTEVLGDVESVTARTTQLQTESGDHDTLSAQFNLESGAFGSFTYAKSLGASDRTLRFQIFGTEGSLVLEGTKAETQTVTLNHGKGADDAHKETFELERNLVDGLVPEFENFVEAATKKDKNLIVSTPAKAFHHFAVIVAAVDSAKHSGHLEKVQSV